MPITGMVTMLTALRRPTLTSGQQVCGPVRVRRQVGFLTGYRRLAFLPL